jgi:hypothetical protein
MGNNARKVGDVDGGEQYFVARRKRKRLQHQVESGSHRVKG